MSNDPRSLRGCAAGRPNIFKPPIFRLLHSAVPLKPCITRFPVVFLLFGETFKYYSVIIIFTVKTIILSRRPAEEELVTLVTSCLGFFWDFGWLLLAVQILLTMILSV
jgi:hypothetical protein